jgi:hypothetical protein
MLILIKGNPRNFVPFYDGDGLLWQEPFYNLLFLINTLCRQSRILRTNNLFSDNQFQRLRDRKQSVNRCYNKDRFFPDKVIPVQRQ